MQPQENPAYALYKEYYATFRNYNGYEHEKAHRMACGAAQYVPNELDRAVERQQNPELYAMFDQMQRMYMNQGHDETTATRRAKAYCGMQ